MQCKTTFEKTNCLLEDTKEKVQYPTTDTNISHDFPQDILG